MYIFPKICLEIIELFPFVLCVSFSIEKHCYNKDGQNGEEEKGMEEKGGSKDEA